MGYRIAAKHIVLIGLNYQPHKSTGDKNFWVHLIPLLARELNQLTIISIRKHESILETYKIHDCQIYIHYLSPAFLETPDAEYKFRIFWKKGAFPSKLGLVEKMLDAQRINRKLREIHSSKPFSHVHLMDTFGFGNKSILKSVKFLNSTISLSLMGYQGRVGAIYHPYLRQCLKYPDLVVIPYSRNLRDKLLEVGLNPDNVIRIPWGVSPPGANNIISSENKNLKIKLNIPVDKPLFLWAGYIQQIQKKDFLFAVQNAMLALQKGLDAFFYFSFKPESFEKGFEKFNNPSIGIIVESTDVKKFTSLKSIADVFYSPVVNKRCILAPPLTWIEMMATGVPILTTNVPGAEEIVDDGNTGFIASNENDLVKKMLLIKQSFRSLRQACTEKIKYDYNIHNIAERYLDLWLKREE